MRVWGTKEAYAVGDLASAEQAHRLEEALGRLPGIERVQVDVARRLVRVVYHTGAVASGAIEAVIRRLGFRDVRRA